MTNTTVFTLQTLADLVGGRVVGNGSTECVEARPLQEAAVGHITLLDDPKRIAQVARSQAAAVVVEQPVAEATTPQLVVSDIHAAFAQIIRQFRPDIDDVFQGISDQARISPQAEIGEHCTIHPGVHIGAGAKIGSGTTLMPGVVIMPHCRVGSDCHLFPNVVLYPYSVLEDRVVIHVGSVIGAYGFGYRQEGGRHIRTAQLGYVHIESDVELGAAVTVDRGTYGTTRIGTGTKVDNQVMIAHNCQIGRHNLICSQVGVAGSCSTGDYVVMAGQVGLKDHVRLGDGAIVGAQAGVMEDLSGGEVYLGSPATSQRDQMQIMAVQRRLPEMRKSLQRLVRQVEKLAARVEQAEQAEQTKQDDRDSRAA
ncbi:UDP-3-O-(3-hydroxymyristoyl)glucosamine N-acyltransferase [Roseimaritima ulvae]|uniref:UDP-3-O-acylglucosamine N-acyltransferase n=1 Tax=Roseimaritima ulvae TaxID=980254 RepID=A0A5B9R7G0_9BACT|nr:UDP-3-O-(3-hydroxymyristoyl)glucosamine N-acyltransferase [Roseimaritima ulvae]QEG42621.1 UDP-3-O-acylglucosamine N-acyltransferase [Roseimaritima ulvae]